MCYLSMICVDCKIWVCYLSMICVDCNIWVCYLSMICVEWMNLYLVEDMAPCRGDEA